MSLHIDGIELTDGQRMTYCADDEHEQTPRIRATFDPEYPVCVTTPSGEPIRAFKQYKHAVLAIEALERDLEAA
jgi:hypothetical protein